MKRSQIVRRFTSEESAKEWARQNSKGTVLYVVESPPPEYGNPHRFVVDSEGFVRNWERLIATYENGVRDD